MKDKKTRSISVPGIDADDYDILKKNGVKFTILMRKTIKDEADRFRVLEKNKNRELKKLEQ